MGPLNTPLSVTAVRGSRLMPVIKLLTKYFELNQQTLPKAKAYVQLSKSGRCNFLQKTQILTNYTQALTT